MRARMTLTVLLAAALLAGCQTDPQTDAKKDALHSEAEAALKQIYADDPGVRDLVNRSTGYAIFPNVGKGGLIVGGAYGRGLVYQQGRFMGYADLTQASVGLQLGGQTFKELLVFENSQAFDNFKTGKLKFTANASAVAVKAGAAAQARFTDGVAAFVQPNGGAMFELSIGGQEFSFKPAAEADRN